MTAIPFSSSSSLPTPPPPMIVIFGRPGSGKTTVANAALERLSLLHRDGNGGYGVLGLDLDACVPRWMKDNFARGIYPTLSQRRAFAREACKYVETEQQRRRSTSAPTIVSFSFVNPDIRVIFRDRFPHASWVLIDTDDAEAAKRIRSRKDHFYKGKTSKEDGHGMEENVSRIGGSGSNEKSDVENSEWEFAPVTYPHAILNGKDSIEINAEKVADFIMQAMANSQPEYS